MNGNNLILQFNIRKGKRKKLLLSVVVLNHHRVARDFMLDRLQIRLRVGLMAFGR
jgi:hypothetical protein